MDLNEAKYILNEAGYKIKQPEEEKIILNCLSNWEDKYIFSVNVLPSKISVSILARKSYDFESEEISLTELKCIWDKKSNTAYCNETDVEDDYVKNPANFALFIDQVLEDNKKEY